METDKQRWAIELIGDEDSLRNAIELFRSENLTVREETLAGGGNVTLMTSMMFESLDDRREVNDVADALVRRLNAFLFVGRLRRSKHIRLAGGPMERGANGGWNYSLIAEAGTYVIDTGSEAAPALTPRGVSRWLEMADADDVVVEVLDFVRTDADWFSLYKAFERMRDDINQHLRQHRLSKMGWPGKTKLNHFTSSATVHRHSRAGWPEGYSLDNAMNLDEGRDFVRGLMQVWLDWRCR